MSNALLEQFVTEARELVDQSASALVKLERSPDDADLVNTVFRAVHTLKGASGLFDIAPLTNLVHVGEDLLSLVRSGDVELTPEAVDLLLSSLDQVGEWLGDLEAQDALPDEAGEVAAPTIAALRAMVQAADTGAPTGSTEGGDTSVAVELGAPPAYVFGFSEEHRLQAVRAAVDGVMIFAVQYEPNPHCFFTGDDPLFLLKNTPGRLATRVRPVEDWPAFPDLDPFRCNLRFDILAATDRASLDEVFQYVPDEVAITPLDPRQLIFVSGDGLAHPQVAVDFAEVALAHLREGDTAALTQSAQALLDTVPPLSRHAALARALIVVASAQTLPPWTERLVEAIAEGAPTDWAGFPTDTPEQDVQGDQVVQDPTDLTGTGVAAAPAEDKNTRPSAQTATAQAHEERLNFGQDGIDTFEVPHPQSELDGTTSEDATKGNASPTTETEGKNPTAGGVSSSIDADTDHAVPAPKTDPDETASSGSRMDATAQSAPQPEAPALSAGEQGHAPSPNADEGDQPTSSDDAAAAAVDHHGSAGMSAPGSADTARDVDTAEPAREDAVHPAANHDTAPEPRALDQAMDAHAKTAQHAGADGDGTPPEAAAPTSPKADAPAYAQARAASADVKPAAKRNDKPPAEKKILRVDQARIDQLMDLIGELVVAKNSIPFLARRARDPRGARELSRALKDHYSSIDRITQELQDAVMAVRMLPVNNVFQRFPRLVRDLSRKLNKEITLHMEGEDTEADATVIEKLVDPMVHILRNAIDHGIESPDVREEAGKPRMGSIHLRATHEGDRVVIEVVDDGGGINIDRVKAKAVEQGLIDADRAEAMSDAEAAYLIMAAGFSTKSEVSDLSGRGVGMDVVRTNIEKAGGTVTVTSERGQGSRIRLTLPLTMAVTRVMTMECAGDIHGVPMDMIRETVKVPQSALQRIKGRHVMTLRDEIIPLLHLNQLLGQPHDTRPTQNGSEVNYAVLVLNVAGNLLGVIVDDFRDIMEVIVKPLDGVLNTITGYLGTALLGDGRVILILDLNELIECQ